MANNIPSPILVCHWFIFLEDVKESISGLNYLLFPSELQNFLIYLPSIYIDWIFPVLAPLLTLGVRSKMALIFKINNNFFPLSAKM